MALVGLALGGGRAAQAQPVDAGACILDNESAQDLEAAGRLREARAKALSCAQGCPTEIARDCTALAERITQKVSTVIFGAKQGSSDLVDVSVSVDGQVIASRLDGKPIELDPGARKVTFTMAGQAPVELQIVFKAGEKNRLVGVEFTAGAASTSPTPRPAPTDDAEGASPPALFWILGGVSVAGFVTAGVTGGLALSERGDLDGCIETRTCDEGDVSSVETKALVADVFIGIGSAFAVGAVLAWVLWPDDEPAAVKPTVSLGPAHSFVGVTAPF